MTMVAVAILPQARKAATEFARLQWIASVFAVGWHNTIPAAFVEATAARAADVATGMLATITLKRRSPAMIVIMPSLGTIVSASVSKKQIVLKCAAGRPKSIVVVCVRAMVRSALDVPIHPRATMMLTLSFQMQKRVCLARPG